jgi:hypothetical protein
MRAAEPLTDMMSLDDHIEVVEAWDYMPGEESCPFEPKASDWGWFKGRRVALDYSTPAWVADDEEPPRAVKKNAPPRETPCHRHGCLFALLMALPAILLFDDHVAGQ